LFGFNFLSFLFQLFSISDVNTRARLVAYGMWCVNAERLLALS